MHKAGGRFCRHSAYPEPRLLYITLKGGFGESLLAASSPEQKRKDEQVDIGFIHQNEKNESINKADFCKFS